MAKTGYDAAAPVMLSVRVRATVVVVVVVGATVVAGAGADVGAAAIVTETVCGEPTRVVWALLAVSVMENPAAAVMVESTATPLAAAVDVAVMVHTVPEV
jgi:hypothetical protein